MTELQRRPRSRPTSSGRFPRIDAEMEDRAWSAADLARAAGLPYGRLVRALLGYEVPSEDTQDRVARVLSLKPFETWMREAGAESAESA